MKREDAYEKGLVSVLIEMIIFVIKWLFLGFGVVFIAISIVLAVMCIIKGADLPELFLARMVAFISGYEVDYISSMISKLGMIKVELIGIAYAVALAIMHCLSYVLVGRFAKLYESIFQGDMFNKENVDLINGALPISLVVAFVPAVISAFIVEVIGVFNQKDILVYGVVYVCIVYILKLIFEKGYESVKTNLQYNKQILDLKAQEDELKMEAIRMEAELKAKRAAAKKTTTVKKEEKPKKEEVKKATKKVAKEKTVAKKTEKAPVKKEEKKTVKKVATKKATKEEKEKKTTTKKTTTKKTAKK